MPRIRAAGPPEPLLDPKHTRVAHIRMAYGPSRLDIGVSMSPRAVLARPPLRHRLNDLALGERRRTLAVHAQSFGRLATCRRPAGPKTRVLLGRTLMAARDRCGLAPPRCTPVPRSRANSGRGAGPEPAGDPGADYAWRQQTPAPIANQAACNFPRCDGPALLCKRPQLQASSRTLSEQH